MKKRNKLLRRVWHTGCHKNLLKALMSLETNGKSQRINSTISLKPALKTLLLKLRQQQPFKTLLKTSPSVQSHMSSQFKNFHKSREPSLKNGLIRSCKNLRKRMLGQAVLVVMEVRMVAAGLVNKDSQTILKMYLWWSS